MIISHSQKFIFIHVQRTGGSTMINLLKKQLSDKVEVISQHGNAKSSESYLLENHKDYYTFGFARNPWDRILSWYLLINKNDQKSLAEEKIRFEKFLDLDHSAAPGDQDFHYNQLDYFSDHNGKLYTNKIYRFEDYEKEINSLFTDLDLPMIDIPQMNKTRSKNYRDYYTSKSRQMIALKCQMDIEYFCYEF